MPPDCFQFKRPVRKCLQIGDTLPSVNLRTIVHTLPDIELPLPRDSFATFACASRNSCFAIASAAARFALPRRTFFEDSVLPPGVLGPVERVQGFHERIKAACRAFLSSVQPLAMICPLQKFVNRQNAYLLRSQCHVSPRRY